MPGETPKRKHRRMDASKLDALLITLEARNVRRYAESPDGGVEVEFAPKQLDMEQLRALMEEEPQGEDAGRPRNPQHWARVRRRTGDSPIDLGDA